MQITWKINVPIFRNAIILKQLGIAVGIPFSLVSLVIGITSGRSVYTLYGLGLVGALLLFTWLFIMIVYKGNYEAEFVLDNKGVLCRTLAEQTVKNRAINSLTVILGLFSGIPAAAGAGILAQSRQEVLIRWSSITKIIYKPKNHVILLRGGWMENVALFCTEENYALVENIVVSQTKPLKRGH